MLHDLGLTDRYRLRDDRQQCFCVVGTRKASELGTKHQWTDKRARLAANAIALHLNVTLDSRAGKEAQMVRAGAGADAAGFGLDMLNRDQIESVVACYPRYQMKREMLRALSIEAEARAGGRVAFLQRRLGLARLIGSTPVFSE